MLVGELECISNYMLGMLAEFSSCLKYLATTLQGLLVSVKQD